MSKELSNFNIRVNTIAPGLTDTKLMRESTKNEAINKTIERISLKRIGTPEEIAKVALFLASDMSSYITGQIIKVDGGLREE
jgi:3-oxoacyl-[acyl-carrier protein] reductase